MVTVGVGRMDNMKMVDVAVNTTIATAFQIANVPVTTSEKIMDVDNNVFSGCEPIVAGKMYYLVTKGKDAY